MVFAVIENFSFPSVLNYINRHPKYERIATIIILDT